jgi:hypothetical protein
MDPKQILLYRVYLNDGPLGKGPNRNELHMHKTGESRDPMLLVTTIAKYALGYYYASKMPHLEGDSEVFGSPK